MKIFKTGNTCSLDIKVIKYIYHVEKTWYQSKCSLKKCSTRKLEESKDVFTHNTEKWNIDKGNKPATKRHGAALSHEKGKELQW